MTVAGWAVAGLAVAELVADIAELAVVGFAVGRWVVAGLAVVLWAAGL